MCRSTSTSSTRPTRRAPERPSRAASPAADLLRLVRQLCYEHDVAGVDVVEVSPAYDHAELTVNAAHRVVFEALGGMAARRRDASPDAKPGTAGAVTRWICWTGCDSMFRSPRPAWAVGWPVRSWPRPSPRRAASARSGWRPRHELREAIHHVRDAAADRAVAVNLLMPFVRRSHVDVCVDEANRRRGHGLRDRPGDDRAAHRSLGSSCSSWSAPSEQAARRSPRAPTD